MSYNEYLKLANSSNIEDRIKLAKMPDCPIDIWEQVLSTLDVDTNTKILYHIVKEPNCSKDILYKIVSLPDYSEYFHHDDLVFIKQNIAQRDDCTLDMLQILAKHGWEDIRCFVASNKNVSIEILRDLSDDEDFLVLQNILLHKKCTNDIIVRIYRNVYDLKDYIDWKDVFETAEELIKERNIDLSKYFEEKKDEITSDFIVELKDNIEETTDFIAELHCIEFNDSENETLRIYTKPNSSLGRIKLIELTKNENEDNTTYKYILNIEKDETDLRYRTIIKVKDDLVKALNQTIIMIEETPLRCYIDDIQYIIDNI